MVALCYMLLCPCVHGLKQYGHMISSYPLCFLFCNLNRKYVKLDVIAVLNDHLLEKNCSVGLLCVSFVNVYLSVYILLSLLVLRVGCGI